MTLGKMVAIWVFALLFVGSANVMFKMIIG